jgi:hypothetical protein
MLSEIVRSYMTGPIEGSSVEAQAIYWIFKIILLDFQRLFHRYALQSQWFGLRLSSTPLFPTQPNDVLFTSLCSAVCTSWNSRVSERPRKPRAFKNLARNGAAVSCKNEKNEWMDSEIFWGQFFDKFPHYQTFPVIRPPVGTVYIG